MEFGRLLRGYRLRAGRTQEELAERSGISAHTISVLESGRRRPRLSTLAALATGLDLSADDRAGLTGAANAAPTIPPTDPVPAAATQTTDALGTRVLAARLEDAEPLLTLGQPSARPLRGIGGAVPSRRTAAADDNLTARTSSAK